MTKKEIITVIGIIAGAIVLAGLYYYFKDGSSESPSWGSLPDVGGAGKPLEKMPDINPADKANPFKSVKTNPFE